MSFEQVDFDRARPIRQSDARLSRQYPAHQYRTGTSSDPIGRPQLSLVPERSRLDVAPATTKMISGRRSALCAQTDPEAFFPEKGGSTREAKRICLGCEVRDACLDYALANDERFGIWGGLSERERRRLKRGII